MVTETIFLFLVFLLPYITWNGAYEGPKVYCFLIFVCLITVYWILNLGRRLTEKIKNYDLFFFLFLLVLTISSLAGIHPLESITGGSYRHQGVLFFLGLWIVGKTISAFSDDSKKIMRKIFVFWAVSQGLLSFLKPLGTIGEKNAVAGLIAIASGFLPAYLLILALASIVVLTSRSGFLAILPAILTRVKNIPKKVYLLLIPLALFVFISGQFYRPAYGVENRFLLAKIAIESIKAKPLIGYGAEAGEVVYDNYFKSIQEPLAGIIIDRSHNLILDLLMWSGIVGTIFFWIWFFLKAKELVFLKKWSNLSAVSSFLIYSFFQPLSIVHWLLLLIVFDL